MSYEESNAASLAKEATEINSATIEQDKPVEESLHEILMGSLDVEVRSTISDAITSDVDPQRHSDSALEAGDIKRDEFINEEAHDTRAKAGETTNVEEEEMVEGCIIEEIHVAYKERDAASELVQDVKTKDIDEQILVGNIKLEANETSKSEPFIADVPESDTTQDEQLSTPEREMKEVKDLEKEIPEQTDTRYEKIGPEVREICSWGSHQDQKPLEQSNIGVNKGSQGTAESESRFRGKECIEKDEQIEDEVSAANEATEDIPREKDEVQSTSVESLKPEPPEKDIKTGSAEFSLAIEKSSDLTFETEMTIGLMYQKSEITEPVEFETHSQEKLQGSKDSEIRSLIFEEETVEAGKENESDEDANATCEISSENLATGKEGDSEYDAISRIEISLIVRAADSNIDGGQNIVSDVLAMDTEEHAEEKVSEKAETSHEESNAASLDLEATGINSADAEQDEPVKKSAHHTLTGSLDVKVRTTSSDAITRYFDPKSQSDNALETNIIERDGTFLEEACDAHGEADGSASIKEEVIEKGCLREEIHAAYKEKDSISVPDEDVAAKDLNEQTLAGTFEPQANANSKSEWSIANVLERDAAQDEQIGTPVEEMKEVKKENTVESVSHCEKIGPDEPEISSWEAQQDEKPGEQTNSVLEKGSHVTAETEIRLGGEGIEEGLTTKCLSAEGFGEANCSTDPFEATDVTEETTMNNMDVAGRKLESGGIVEEISQLEPSNNREVPQVEAASVQIISSSELEMQLQAPVSTMQLEAESPDTAHITEETEETTKGMEPRRDTYLLSAFAPEAAEEVCLRKAVEISTKAAESVPDININELSNQLEGTEIKEKHFEVTMVNSVAEEQSMKIGNEILPDTTFGEEPVHPFVQKQELSKPQTTEEIQKQNNLKDEEVIKDKTNTLMSTSNEPPNQEGMKEHSLDEGRAKNKSDIVFVEKRQIKKSFPHEEEGITAHEEVAESNVQNEKNKTDFGNSLTETTAFRVEVENKKFEVEGEPTHKEIFYISQEIKQGERISTETPGGEDPDERSPCKTMKTTTPTGEADASLKLEQTAATFSKPEKSNLGSENPYLPKHGEKVVHTLGEKACEEPALTDAAAVSLSDLLKKAATEKFQAATLVVETKYAINRSLELQAEEAEMAKAEEAKTDEERDEQKADEDEHRMPSPERDTPVTVESSKDIVIKAQHKKSHNILSGVGSKVKHSISKVKKAITGKSSHSKTLSPKQSS